MRLRSPPIVPGNLQLQCRNLLEERWHATKNCMRKETGDVEGNTFMDNQPNASPRQIFRWILVTPNTVMPTPWFFQQMEQQNAGKLTDFSLFVPVVLMLFLVRPGHPWEKKCCQKNCWTALRSKQRPSLSMPWFISSFHNGYMGFDFALLKFGRNICNYWSGFTNLCTALVMMLRSVTGRVSNRSQRSSPWVLFTDLVQGRGQGTLEFASEFSSVVKKKIVHTGILA